MNDFSPAPVAGSKRDHPVPARKLQAARALDYARRGLFCFVFRTICIIIYFVRVLLLSLLMLLRPIVKFVFNFVLTGGAGAIVLLLFDTDTTKTHASLMYASIGATVFAALALHFYDRIILWLSPNPIILFDSY